MTGALSRLRSELTAQLNRAGIPAMAAYEPERQVRRTEPMAAVSLAKVVCAPGGFRDYLGRRTAADGWGPWARPGAVRPPGARGRGRPPLR